MKTSELLKKLKQNNCSLHRHGKNMIYGIVLLLKMNSPYLDIKAKFQKEH
ncbi:hypothetical protein M2150_000119 [Lachnospiraceae bacterium PM6-15]